MSDDTAPSRTVVALTKELIDRSRISGGIDGVRFARPGDDLSGADIVIADLAVGGALAAAIESGARVIAYASHVDDAVLEVALELGAEAMPRSRFFRRLSSRTLL